MPECREQCVDVFLTKPDTGIDKQEYTFDDQLVCSVQSVRKDPSYLTNPNAHRAVVVEAATNWIMPTWSKDYSDGSAPIIQFQRKLLDAIQVGDLIRVGNTDSVGFSDYLTVMEKVNVERIHNGTNQQLPITSNTALDVSAGGNDEITFTTNNSTQNCITTYGTGNAGDQYYDLSSRTSGISHIALRVNYPIDCTTLPHNYPIDASINKGPQTNGTYLTADMAQISNRNKVTANGKPFYPMYVANRWAVGSTLRTTLDHSFKNVDCIKLAGYSLALKRQVGVHAAHEMQADDYIIVRIKEIEGKVCSNNKYANGAFAVLYSGDTQHNNLGAIEYSRFDTVNGVVTQHLDTSSSGLRNLTLQVTDRLGRPAHFGRLHLWFKLHVTHG